MHLRVVFVGFFFVFKDCLTVSGSLIPPNNAPYVKVVSNTKKSCLRMRLILEFPQRAVLIGIKNNLYTCTTKKKNVKRTSTYFRKLYEDNKPFSPIEHCFFFNQNPRTLFTASSSSIVDIFW